MKLVNNRYKIIDILERDVYGTTYIATDLSNKNTKILLKMIDLKNRDKKFIDYLINNFIFIASVNHIYIQKCNSFNVINTIDNKKFDDFQYFYTTEHADKNLGDYKSFSKQEINDLFIKLCYALDYLHFRGINYKFLNFKNIMIVNSGNNTNYKLKDLITKRQYYTNVKTINKHNVQFIAPEIRLGREGDNSSDIYSLGVILFYLVSGLDYKKNNFSEISKQSKDNHLYKVIEKMTAPDPGSRYKNILEVINDIEVYINVDYNFFDKDYYEKLNFNIPLVNREKEKKKTLEYINGKLLGKSKKNFIFVHGEAGVGKSRFVKEIKFQVAINKISVCSIELNQENNGIFNIYKRILRFIVKGNKIDNELVNKYGSELVKILPDLASMWNIKPSETLAEDKEILRLNNRIYNFIIEFTAKNPLIIIIDNINYAHKNDLNILDYLVKNAKESSLIFICTYIDKESHNIREFLNRFKQEINTSFIGLRKMSFEETSIMLRSILGMNHRPMKLTTKIMEETSGNPRYVEEIVKSLFVDKEILVSEFRVWMADIDDVYNLKLPSSVDDAILKSIGSLDFETRKVLDIISIFHTPVSIETICKVIDADQNTTIKILVKLVSLRIINEKFEDWGYSYDYYDKYIKKFIYNNISEEEKKIYHSDAANILEKFYISEGRDYTVELVYHYTNCGSFNKATKYCIKAAEKMEQLHIYNQAIIFYNRAIEFLRDFSDIKALVNVLMKMGHIYVLTGELSNAFEKFTRVVEISEKGGLERPRIDSQNKLAYIHFYKNEIDIAEDILEETIMRSKKIGYIEGELEGALQQCKLLAFTKTYPNLKNLLGKYINKSLKSSQFFYTAQFFNEKGKLCYEEGEMHKARYCFEQSIFFFEKSNNNIGTTSPLNNIGVLYLEAYKNITKAREYYNKALNLFEKYNYITDKNIYLMNIGETYFYEDMYSNAINYFDKAVDISIEIGDTSILFASYIHLCHTYLNLYQYHKAYFYLQKLQAEFKKYCRHDLYFYEYYLIHINFYTQIHNYHLADKWHDEFLNAIQDRKADFDLELKSLEIKMFKFQASFHPEKIINVDEIKQFLLENIDKIQLKPVRNFLINLIYILMIKGERDYAKYFIDFDTNLKDEFNTHILDFKKSFAIGLLSENKIEFFKELLNKLENKELYEYEWRIFKILGDEYYERDDYFNALSNYITALDILKSLSYRIPEELRKSYIFGYEINYIVKQRIEDLKTKILGKEKNESCKIESIIDRESIEEFFDFSDLNTFFNNKEFMKSVYKESREELPVQITEIKDLIQNLKKDELFNIKLILKYCVRLCLAERGFVFITNELGEIQEIINIGNHYITQEIKDVLRTVNNRGRDIIVTNQKQFDSNSFKHNEIKSLICIPIKNFDQENLGESNVDNQRKFENRIYSNEIAGYMYLDTKRVFNNFTQETYDKCCSLMNLLFVMIQNYDLKKVSSIDKLTNVYLRKHIEDLFKKEMLISQRNELNLSVIMCDIDKFKNVNDFYGHRKGDEVLAKIGKILKNNLRKTDLVGRYGGEEFIIILPETDINDAYIVCEKLRNVVEDRKLLGNNTELTISFGISSYPDNGRSEEELIEKADQALYKSKKGGRNRTTIWNENIGYDKHRYDKLAGIITGNISTDHRNVNFILDVIELLKKSTTKTDKIFEVLGYLIEIAEAEFAVIYELKDGIIDDIFARKRANSSWVEEFKFHNEIISDFIDKKQGDFFIDWNDISTVDNFTGVPSWNSFIIVPIINDDVQKGILLLSVPISEKEFDFKVFNLVNSLSGIIGSMI
ncbi:diguanylate cyclase [Wukongibacter sp. M2B1]|uniref:diguanylate cyclase n=1 Tax=Wukongibacter sp. M2B1 TaxID=3088895 RepID=UPI003D7A3A6B